MSSVSNEKTIPLEDVSPAEMCQCASPKPIHSSPLQFSQGNRPRVRNWYCGDCLEEHPSYCTYCPNKPCTICFTPNHHPARCPYLRHVSRDVNYDWVNYSVVCGCGDSCFDEENWFCPRCGGQSSSTRLILKNWAEFCPKDNMEKAMIAGAAREDAIRRWGEAFRAAAEWEEAFRRWGEAFRAGATSGEAFRRWGEAFRAGATSGEAIRASTEAFRAGEARGEAFREDIWSFD